MTLACALSAPCPTGPLLCAARGPRVPPAMASRSHAAHRSLALAVAGLGAVAAGGVRGWRRRRAGGRWSRARVRRFGVKVAEAEALQRAWLFDAALDMVMDLEHPRAKAVKAAALVGLQRFSEAREVLDEINWKDLLVAAETYLDRTEFLQRCKVLERQSETSESMADGHGDDGDRSLDRFRFSDVFGSMLQAREKKRDPAMPMTPTAALLPPVPEAAANVEVRSSSSGRGLFATGPTKAGDVILCGLPLARCLNASGEPLVPALRQAAELSPHVRRVLSLLSDGTNDTKAVSLKDFSWRHDISPLRTETGMMPMSEEQLAQVVRINSFDLFGSSALFGATSMANHSCCPSASSMSVGNAIFVRANRPSPPGGEIQISYFDVLKPFQQRQKRTQSWSFQCECPRCNFERSLPSHLQESGTTVDVVESETVTFPELEAQWLRASHFSVYMKELEELFPLSQEAKQLRRTMLKAMEVTDPASFTHTKLSFLDWLATKSLKGPQDSETLQAMRYCDWVHQARYGKVAGKELVPLLKCTQQATESTGVGEEFCNPWMKVARPALSSPSSASSAAVPSESAKSATMLLD